MDSEMIWNKAQRLFRISCLLFRNPQGLTSRELARLCQVGQRTIQRDIQELGESGTPVWQSDDRPPRYGIEKGYYIPPIHFSLPEAVALYLAGRLLARYCDHCDVHTPAALAKLASVLPEPISHHMHATIAQLATRQEDSAIGEIMEVLASGWAAQRVVHILYRGAGHEAAREYRLHPYCLEASGEGGAVYVIGWAEPANDLRTFKLERILKAELTAETFQFPPDFDGPQLLDGCWGIMYGDAFEQVTLRFAPSATRRVKETIWHSSQRLTDLPDGGCELHLTLAHPEEMVYWIRGWGPQVQVMTPAWLRARLAAEARELVDLYQEEGR